MNKLFTILLLVSVVFNAPIYSQAQDFTSDRDLIEDQYMLRASRIISGSSWSLSKKAFALFFLEESTGYGTVTMQRKNGTSWVDVGSLDIEFTRVITIGDNMDANTSLSGTYRMVYDITVGSKHETIESSTQSK